MFARPPKPVSVTLNLAPMVDVMMCLIIFFLLASKLVRAQQGPLKLPWAEAAREVEPGELGERVVITIRIVPQAQNRCEFVVQSWDGQRVSDRVLLEDQISTFLQARVRQVGDPEMLRCVIRADREVAYGDVEVVMRGCGLAKIGKITFAAHPGEDPEDRRR